MIRFIQRVLLGVVAVLAISFATSAQESRPDYKFDVKDFATEVYKDGKAAMTKYKGKKIELTGLVGDASKTYTPKGFNLRTELKASKLKGALKSLALGFNVDLPAEVRKDAWKLPTKQKVVIIAELAEVRNDGIRVTAPGFKKAE